MKKKKLLILTNSPHHYQGAGGRTRIVHEIKEILNQEANIHLFCLVSLKYIVHFGLMHKARKQLEVDTGVKVIYFPSLPTFHGLLTNFVNALNACVIWAYTRFWNCRNIHAQGIYTALPIVLLKKIDSSIRLLTDVHGVLPEEHFYGKSNFNQKEFEHLNVIEKRILENSEFVLLVSNQLRKHYQTKYGISLDNSLILPCLTNDIPDGQTLLGEAIPEKMKDIGSDRIIFTYSGSYRKYQLVDESFNLFLKIKEQFSMAFFLIMTNQVDIFVERAKEFNIHENDFKIISLKRDEVQSYLIHTDFGILLRDNSVVNIVSSPTKFAEYLLAGLPVITTNYVGDYSAIVNKERIGYVVENISRPEDNLFGFIKEYLSDKVSMKEKARQYGESHLTWNTYKMLTTKTLKEYKFL